MKKTLATALACVMAGSVGAKTLTIGIDLSGSNPLLSHINFAHGAAAHAHAAISALKPGDVVQLKTFGARDSALNLLQHHVTISRRDRAAKVAGQVAQYIRTLPEQTKTGQSSTNLIAWLEFTDGFDCQQDGQVLVITDGLESSSYVNAKDLLSGKKTLPAPDVDLNGCGLTFYGLGAGWPPKEVKRVRKAWQAWADQAGAAFTAIIP